MRAIGAVLLLAGLTLADENVFKGETRLAKGPEGRVTVKVPKRWPDIEVAGSAIIRVRAPGSYGGHDLIVAREEGQDDVDKQRDRYLEYDSGNHKNATVKKFSEPYFGYRLNIPDKNRIICRAFLSDGADGLVISATSRFTHYDRLWAKMIAAILGSVEVKGGGGDGPRDQGELRRLYDSLARVSIVVPALWKSLKPDSDKTLLFIALKGARKGPRFSIKDTATRLKPNLILLKISSQWKKTYGGGLQISRLGLDPPRMMVKNRIPGSVDYLIAFSAGGQGYIFQLTCREGSFEKYRSMGDAFAKTIVFAAGSWTPPAIEPRELKEVFKKLANVHASVEQTSSVDAVMRALAGFFKHWPRLAPAFGKKAPPLEILVVGTDEFKEASHFYGRPPVVYDRSTRVVVVAPRPKEKSRRAAWVGRLYWALGEAALHRDLAVPAPPWLRAGFCGCIEAAGRTGKGPREPHSGYVERLLLKTETDSQMGLRDVLKMTDADIYLAQKPDMKVQAWGYLHMLLYGKSVLGAAYKKWAKALKNARGRTPAWDLKDYAKDKVDLKKHAARNWAKK